MMFFQGINYPAVIVSTVVYYIIGFLWYTVLFGETWRKETGVTDKTKPPAWALVGQFISTLIYTLGIAIILKMQGTPGVAGAIYVSAFLTVFFVIPVHSGNLFFTGKRKLFLLDVCERALGSLVVGIILGIWP